MLHIFSNLTGSVVNAVAVIIGGLLGMMFKKSIPEKFSKTIMTGLGLCVAYIGITGSLKGQNTLILVLATVFGIIIGEALNLDTKVERFGMFAQRKLSKNTDGDNRFAEGFVTASLLFCIGSMTILGSIESGVGSGFSRHTTLLVKSVLDFVSAMVFGTQFGIGVIFSSVFILLFQGLITIIATFVGNFLSAAVIAEMTCAGSIILIGIGTNMMGLTKIKTVNFVPGIFIAAGMTALAEFLGIYLI